MTKRKTNRTKLLKIAFGVIGTFAVSIIVLQFFMIRDLYARVDQLGLDPLKGVMIDALHAQNTDPAVDHLTGKQYIPSAKLVFPANPPRRWYYSGGGDEGIYWLADANSQNQATAAVRSALTMPDTFKAVATAKSCSRQVIISVGDTDPSPLIGDKLGLVKTVSLKDGRTAKIYQNSACAAGSETLLKVAAEVQSF